MERLWSLLWLPLATNAVLLVAILGYGMDVRQLLVLYWAENFIVGLWNLARIAVAQPPAWTNRRPVRLWPLRFAYAFGFSLVYFSLNLGMGLVLAGIMIGDLQGRAYGFDAMQAALQTDASIVCLAVLAVSHGIAFFANYVGRREYLAVTPQELRNGPFPRMLVTVVLCLWGAPALVIVDTPMLGVYVFVGVKTAVDLWLAFRERGRQAAAARTAGRA